MKRVSIGEGFDVQPMWKVVIGVPLVYLPIICSIPFVIVCVLLVKTHLRLMGAKNIRSYWEFVPHWASHRYCYNNQIIYSTGAAWHNLRHYRWYWIFNCKLYCPLSVALFRYITYLVMIVENWWCPFDHDQKSEYQEGAIDKSYWHVHELEMSRLDPEDCANPIWNKTADESDKDGKNSTIDGDK